MQRGPLALYAVLTDSFSVELTWHPRQLCRFKEKFDVSTTLFTRKADSTRWGFAHCCSSYEPSLQQQLTITWCALVRDLTCYNMQLRNGWLDNQAENIQLSSTNLVD